MAANQSIPGLVILLIVLQAGLVCAHETDQFTVPERDELIDIHYYWDLLLYQAIERAVEKTNQEIEAIEKSEGKDSAKLVKLHDPWRMADRVFAEMPGGGRLIELMEPDVKSRWIRARHPIGMIAFKPSLFDSIYENAHLPIDPRLFMKLFRSATVRIHGVDFGTDKVGHFVEMGSFYYDTYEKARLAGKDQAAAMAEAARLSHQGFLSEAGILGRIPAGNYSNADAASNYLGMKYYINLTESTMLQGELRQPMLEREGTRWKIADHVSPQYMGVFVSDHFNEALNPCLWEARMSRIIRSNVADRRDTILDWYAGPDPAKRHHAYFQHIHETLKTYYGEPYGFRGSDEAVVSIANSCFLDADANGYEVTEKINNAKAAYQPHRPWSHSSMISDLIPPPKSATCPTREAILMGQITSEQ